MEAGLYFMAGPLKYLREIFRGGFLVTGSILWVMVQRGCEARASFLTPTLPSQVGGLVPQQ